MTKRKKKSKAGPLAGGIAALALIGALVPSEEPQEIEQTQPPAVIEEVEMPSTATNEELIEEQEVLESPAIAPTVEPDILPEKPPKEEIKQSEYTSPAEKVSSSDPDPIPEPVPEPDPIPPANPEHEQKPPEIDPEKAFREKLMQYAYVGSAESDKYHYPKCGWTDTINDSNLVHFDTEEEAAAAGYIPCGSCKP